MSLRKSPTLTPARLEANRRNSKKSTGPRTAQGKGQSRMNSLRTGVRSRFMRNLYMKLYDAPPGGVGHVARSVLTPEQAAHPKFADLVDMFQQADLAMLRELREKMTRDASRQTGKDGGSQRGDHATEAQYAPSAGCVGGLDDVLDLYERLLSKRRAKPECY